MNVETNVDWQSIVRTRLEEFGHRNWIVIADAAYPAHSSRGVETIVIPHRDLIVVAGQVLRLVTGASHIIPLIYTDRELPYVEEQDAPGVSEYRDALADFLRPYSTVELEHEKIIEKVDEASRTFRVLIVKTGLTIPYTSLFMELECGYWNAEAEERMRKGMRSAR